MFFSTKTISSDKSFHDFSIESISGGEITLADYKNKVVLLVNTASQCGFTPQYAGLQKIYDRYKKDGFVVLGVPSDDFNQELSSDDDVKKFCEIRYGVISSYIYAKNKGESALYISGYQVTHQLLASLDGTFTILIGKDGKITTGFLL